MRLVARVDRALEEVGRFTTQQNAGREGAQRAAIQQLQASVAEVEKIVRVVMSWTATRQDPAGPIERMEEELAGHLVALRTQREKLETAESSLSVVAGDDPTEPLSLRRGIERMEASVGVFSHLARESTGTISALENAASAVLLQVERLEQMLDERDAARLLYERKLAAQQQLEQSKRGRIREEWAERREQLLSQRAPFRHLPEAIRQRASNLPVAAHEGMGVIADQGAQHWPDLIMNQLGMAIDQWEQQVKGLEGSDNNGSDTQRQETLISRLRAALEASLRELESHGVPLNGMGEEPFILALPFWFVQTEEEPDNAANPGRRLHIIPPLQLRPRAHSGSVQASTFDFPEVSRRLLAYLREEVGETPPAPGELHFPPELLSPRASQLDWEEGAIPLQLIATAIAQHWVIARSSDPRLDRIFQNSRDALIPDSQINRALTESSEPPSPTPLPTRPAPLNGGAAGRVVKQPQKLPQGHAQIVDDS
jgi:hypothetical protein